MRSPWEWMSMKPGQTISPAASISASAAAGPAVAGRPATRAPSIRRSARRAGAPDPSISVPPRIRRRAIAPRSGLLGCDGVDRRVLLLYLPAAALGALDPPARPLRDAQG